MSKKSRGLNFSTDEKEILIQLITKHKDLVENKKTDATTSALKNDGWRKLTEDFNSRSSFCVRHTDQLKTCWDNIKRTTRKDRAATKKEVFITGGGKPDVPPPGPFQGQVEILLGPTLDGLDNPYDSDIHFVDQGLSSNLETIEVIETQNDIADICVSGKSQISEFADENKPPEGSEKKDWHSWTPAALKTKVSNKLSVDRADTPSTWLRRRRPKTSLQDKVLQTKLEILEIMKKNTETEGKIKEEQLMQEKIKTAKLQAELDKMNAMYYGLLLYFYNSNP